MVIFAIFFALGVWLLQQQAALPDFGWAWLLFGFLLLHPLSRWRERVRVAAMTRRCEASGAGMAASHPLPQSAGFASNVSWDVRVVERENNFQYLIARSIHTLLLAAFAFGIGFYHASWQAEQRLSVTLPNE